MRLKLIKYCFACGREADIKKSLNSKHVCKNPDPDFATTLAEMSTEQIIKALGNGNSNRDEYFCEQLSRFLCHEFIQNVAGVESEIAADKAKQEQMPKMQQVSDDIERYGTTDRAVDAEGEVEIKIPQGEETAADIAEDIDRSDDKT